MLTELKTLHGQIEICIAELEALTVPLVPALNEVAAARLKLTRVSRHRTTLLEGKIYPLLLDGACAADKASVEALRDTGKRGLLNSIGHIGRWTLPEIADNWTGYCAASRAMRAAMRKRIEEERAVVYPLLARRADLAA